MRHGRLAALVAAVGDPHEHPAEEAPDWRLCDRLEGMLDIGLAGEVQQLLRTRPSELSRRTT